MIKTKNNLILFSLIFGSIFLPLVILATLFTIMVGINTTTIIYWSVASFAWAILIALGVFIIFNSHDSGSKNLLYLFGGVFLITIPIIGMLLLLIDRILE